MPRIVLGAAPLRDGPTALRPWRDSDVPALVEACQDPEITRWTRVPSPYGHADARLYLQQRHDGLHAGATAPYAVIHPDAGRLLGSISLMRFVWEDGRAELGYWLAREARGTGYAVRALQSPPAMCPRSAWPSGQDSRGRHCCARTLPTIKSATTWWLTPYWRTNNSAGSTTPCSPRRSASRRRS